MDADEFDLLLSRLLDDPTDAPGTQALNDCLATDSALRCAYLKAIALEEALTTELQLARSPAAFRARASRMEIRETRTRKKTAVRASFLAAACVTLAAIVFGLVRAKTFRGAHFLTTAETVYSVIRADDGTSPGILGKGDLVRVESGRLQIELGSGVRALLEGPASMEILGRSALRLSRGQGYFEISGENSGLEVFTPHSVYRDIGTRFGLAVGSGGGEEISVFQGQVEVSPLEKGGEPFLASAGQHLSVSTAREWRAVPEKSPSNRYTTSLTGEPQPVAGWSFEDEAPETVAAHPGLAGKISPRFVRDGSDESASPDRGYRRIADGPFGAALRFTGEGVELRTGWDGILGASPRTLSMWIRVPDGEVPQGVVCVWGDTAQDNKNNRKWKLTLNQVSKDGVIGALRLTTGTGRQIGSRRLNDGKWHHLAVSYSDGWPTFYIDGSVEESSSQGILPVDTAAGLPVTFGSGHKIPSKADEPSFRGDLDEFRIYSRALDLRQIDSLFRNNRLNNEPEPNQ